MQPCDDNDKANKKIMANIFLIVSKYILWYKKLIKNKPSIFKLVFLAIIMSFNYKIILKWLSLLPLQFNFFLCYYYFIITIIIMKNSNKRLQLLFENIQL